MTRRPVYETKQKRKERLARESVDFEAKSKHREVVTLPSGKWEIDGFGRKIRKLED